MFDSSYLRRYLQQKDRLYPYRVYVKPPGETAYRIVDEYCSGPEQPSSGKTPVFEKWHSAADKEKNSATLWLRYPEGYELHMHVYMYIEFTDVEQEALYYILYPCYTDQIIKSLNDRIRLLSIRNEIHTRLTNISINNSGMEKIAEEMRSLLEKPLIFVNLANGEQHPAGEKLPANLDLDKLAQMFSRQKEPQGISLSITEQVGSYVCPILSGGVCLGCYILPVEQQPSQLEIMILEQGATIAAIELVKNQSLTELYYRKAYQIFDELIHTNDPTALINKCNELSIDFNASYVAFVFAFTTNIDLQVLEMCVMRLITKLKKELSGIYQTVF